MIYLALILSILGLNTLQAANLSLPSKIETLLNKKHFKHGPNCWGTALYLKGLSSSPRFVSSAEMTYWQSTPLCRPLDTNDKLKAGDIMNVYGPEYAFESDFKLDETQEFINLFEPGKYAPPKKQYYTGFHRLLHSETIVDSKTVFGKLSPNKDDPFTYTKFAEIYGRPRREVECQESPSLTPHFRYFDVEPKNVKDSKCGYFTKVYRCENFSDLISLNGEDQALISEANTYQDRIFQAVTNRNKQLTTLEKNRILDFANKHIKALKDQIDVQSDEHSRMIISWKYFSLQSLIKGIDWLEAND